jgi:hypothetical protein
MPEISTKRLDLLKQAKKWVKKSLQNSNFKKIEESPYKPDTVKTAFFVRKSSFARCFCPFLFVTIEIN